MKRGEYSWGLGKGEERLGFELGRGGDGGRECRNEVRKVRQNGEGEKKTRA